ncbi:MAG: GNAT family N-acetyltransferase, partial [Gammaproteobacteria bacterium]|nr:GNAT family N-acetyltransferase [Gammaproteobacteria bacterium]
MTVQLVDKKYIYPLFNSYITHMSQHIVIEDKEAWYASAMRYLDSYSSDSDRHLFAVDESNVAIGFAMVNRELKYNRDGSAIADFYIQPKHQRRGFGCTLAESVFSHFPGRWEVAVLQGNDSAKLFWRQVIASYTQGDYQEWKAVAYEGSGYTFE